MENLDKMGVTELNNTETQLINGGKVPTYPAGTHQCWSLNKAIHDFVDSWF